MGLKSLRQRRLLVRAFAQNLRLLSLKNVLTAVRLRGCVLLLQLNVDLLVLLVIGELAVAQVFHQLREDGGLLKQTAFRGLAVDGHLALLRELQELEVRVEVVVVEDWQGLAVLVKCQLPLVELVDIALVGLNFSVPNQAPKLDKVDRHNTDLHHEWQLNGEIFPQRLIDLLARGHRRLRDAQATNQAELLASRAIQKVHLLRVVAAQELIRELQVMHV